MLRCRMRRRASAGMLSQNSCGCTALWITNAPPSAMPASGSALRNASGSGDSTTSTWRSSQLRRIGSGANAA